MEPRTFRWVSDLDLDEAGFILQQELISQLNQFSTQEMAATSLDQHKDSQQSLSSENSTLSSSIFSVGNMERAQRVNDKGEPCLFFMPDAPLLLSFDHHQPQPDNIINGASHAKDHGSKRKKLESETESKKMKMDIMKQPAFVHDHIMAERRRREKLSQRFIELAAIIPGLKKLEIL